MDPRKSRRGLASLLVASLLAATAAPAVSAGQAGHRGHCVVVLHSYHEDFAWTRGINEAIRSALGDADPSVQIHVEYMDTKRVDLETQARQLEALYEARYGHKDVSLVIVSDNNALDFLLPRRSRLFGQAPIVFCGVNNYSPELIAGHDDVTGVAETFDIVGTIDLALSLHPGTRSVVVVSDESVSGRLHLAEVRRLAPGYRKRGIRFRELVGLTTDELVRRLGELDERTIVLHLAWFRDAAGRTLSAPESVRIVDEHTNRPIYSMWGWKLGHGVTGGVMTCADLTGRRAARIALEILGGRSAGEIPVEESGPWRTIFDYDKLAEAGLDMDDLPRQAVVRDMPASFWSDHRGLIIWTLVAFAALLGLLGVLAANVVRRSRAERELRDRRDLLGSVLNHIPNYIFWKDTESVYRGCNDNFARLVGVESPERIVGMTDHNLPWPVGTAQEYVASDRRIMQSGGSVMNREEVLRDASGRQMRVSICKAPLRDESGEVRGVLGSLVDNTDRHELETQLRQSQKMEAIGQLAGGVAHDFNNLLAVIQGNAQLLEMYDSGTEETGELLGEIVRASRRAADLTRQLLNFARKSEQRREAVDLHAVVEEVCYMLTHSLDRRIEIRKDLQASHSWLQADPTQLQNAILNLCVNARDAMPEGGTLRLWTFDAVAEADRGGPAPGRCVELVVQDTGIGISSDDQRRIFEPFFTTKEVGRGTGLGLAGVYGFVQNHGGSVRVESQVGQGTSIRIRLPLSDEAAGEEAPPARADADGSTRPGSSVSRGTGRILVVDDEEMVREFADKALSEMGYEVTQAADGQAALDLLDAGDQYDLMLMDLILPRMGGDELFQRVRRRRPGLQVLVMSGYSKRQTVELLLSQGAAGFISKPFTLEEISCLVQRHVQARPAPASQAQAS
jgi:PAS domain S-box-containing protein